MPMPIFLKGKNHVSFTFHTVSHFASNFTTNLLLGKSFPKTKVIRYTAFFKSAEQLLSGTISHGYFFMYLFTKRRQLPSKQLHVQGQQCKNQTGCEMCINLQ